MQYNIILVHFLRNAKNVIMMEFLAVQSYKHDLPMHHHLAMLLPDDNA